MHDYSTFSTDAVSSTLSPYGNTAFDSCIKNVCALPNLCFTSHWIKSNSNRRHNSLDPQMFNAIRMNTRTFHFYHGSSLISFLSARANVLRRAIQKEFEKIRIFPTLIVSSGEKIEGKVTKEQIESFLSRVL
jgi:hypothetical protein